MKPNFRRLARIARILEQPQKPNMPKFHMGNWASNKQGYCWTPRQAVMENPRRKFNECGTAGCIGGYAVLLYPDEVEGSWFVNSAAEILGLDSNDAIYLFMGHFDREVYTGLKDISKITRRQAAKAIRNLIAKHKENNNAKS